MSERNKIQDRIRRKQSEIAQLEDKLRSAKVYLAALQDVIKMLAGEEEPEAIGKLRPGSSVAQAREIILAKGEPVHLDDLITAMGKPLTQSAKSSLAGSLAAYVRQNEIFTRTAPNTFGLIELDHDALELQREVEEPPEGFGRAPVAAESFDDDDGVPF